MRYKIENGILKPGLLDKKKLFVPNNSDDIRNYAATLLYPDNIEQIYRNKYYNYHIDYLYRLYLQSEMLKNYIPYLLKKEEYNHYQFDLFAVKNQTALLYCNDPAKHDFHEYAFYLPEILKDYQKEFLKTQLQYVLKLQKLHLFIYQKQKLEFEHSTRIEEYHGLTSYQTLKKMIQM